MACLAGSLSRMTALRRVFSWLASAIYSVYWGVAGVEFWSSMTLFR